MTRRQALRIERNKNKRGYAVTDPETGERNTLESVTTILGKLDDKPALPWWAMTVACDGIAQLTNERKFPHPVMDANGRPTTTGESLVAALTENKLTVNHVRDSAGERGTQAHDILQAWGETQAIPDLSQVEPERRGYIQGLTKFLVEWQPVIFASEVATASLTHGYAGTFDVGCTPALGPYAGTTCLVDLKTSKRIYWSQGLQLAAYDLAEREVGEIEYDHTIVVQVTPEGDWDFAADIASGGQWLDGLAFYRGRKLIESRLAQEMKLRKAEREAQA